MVVRLMKKDDQAKKLFRCCRYHARHRFLVQLMLLLVACSCVSFLEASLLPTWFQSSATTGDEGGDASTTTTSSSETNKEEETSSNNKDDSWELVDPIVNRELEVSVLAHAWPTTFHNVLCEAWAHWNNDWKFGDGLVQALVERKQKTTLVPPLSNHEQGLELALQASRAMLQQQQQPQQQPLRLLQYALAMRAYSPQCELHRGLARQALQKTKQLSSFHGRDAFLFVVPSGTVLLDNRALQQWILQQEQDQQEQESSETTTAEGNNNGNSNNETLSPWEQVLLPGETPRGGESNSNNSALIILYANLGSPAFAAFYQALVDANLSFVVRYLGDVHFEEDRHSPQKSRSSATTSSSTVLQGYGVRLDIRNVEYKAFDDRKQGQEASADNDRLNVSTLEQLAPHFLAGINLTAIVSPTDTDTDNTPLLNETLAWQHVLWQLHESQQIQSQRIPPTWQRRQLPLQAATVIAAAAAKDSSTDNKSNSKHHHDPLITLTDLSQNLPSVVATLVQIRIPPAISKAAQALEQVMKRRGGGGSGSTALYINGQLVALDRPAWNVFELLSTIKKEQAALQDMQSKLSPWLNLPALRDVQQAWMQGEGFYANKNDKTDADDDASMEEEVDPDEQMQGAEGGSASKVYRIDVGHGWKQAVIYVNDVERDKQYSQWPRSLRQMLMSMQFGMPPMVRRNLFTILAVFDPLPSISSDSSGAGGLQNHGLSLAQQLMQSSFPVRLGVLLINNADVQACQSWLNEQRDQQEEPNDKPCPVPPLFETLPTTITLDDFKNVKISTQAVYRLVSHMSIKYAKDTQVLQAYVEYLLPSIQNKPIETPMSDSDTTSTSLSLYDLVIQHANLLEGMEVMSDDAAREEAFQALTKSLEEESSTTVPLYGRALRFAAEKGLLAGMSFLNGRPLPSTADEDGRSSDAVGQIFMEEQTLLFRMVVSNDITDSRPKSVYGKLLSGPKVFSRMHPLLAGVSGDGTNTYVDIPNSSGGRNAASLLVNEANSNAEAIFVVEAVLDVDTKNGLQAASNFVNVLSKYPTSMKAGRGSIPITMAYRIVPRSKVETNPLCTILGNARTLEATTLKVLLDAAINQPELTTLDALVDQIPDLDSDSKNKILSLATVECSVTLVDWNAPTDNFIVANGRFYSLDDAPPLQRDDLDLLINLDLARTKAVTKLINRHLDPNIETFYDAIARVATFLALEQVGQQKRSNLVDDALEAWKTDGEAEKNPLLFSWNTNNNVDELSISVTAFVDPVTEAAQRLAPLLSVIRDELQLPLTLVLSPKTVLEGDDKIPVTSYYRFVANPNASPDAKPPKAHFSNLPTNHVLTLRMDVPEPWNVQQTYAIQDTDNLVCSVHSGCSDEAHRGENQDVPIYLRQHLTRVEYGLNSLMFFGQCYETSGSPPNGLQLTLTQKDIALGTPAAATTEQEVVIDADGSANVVSSSSSSLQSATEAESLYSDTLVMKNVGYWQLRANPGVWNLNIAKNSKGAEIFDRVEGSVRRGQIVVNSGTVNNATKTLVMKDFVNRGELLLVKRRPGFEQASLFFEDEDADNKALTSGEPEVINVFSLATGHLYERFLKIMMLSVTKRTSTKVKFWLFENFLSPTFKASARFMAEEIGCEVEFVTYKWPEWLRGQSEKQRIIWGYKILFLDVLFPLDVKKIIYVDADQVVRGDLKELWDMDLQGNPYGYTPFCTSRETTLGFQFWRSGFWKTHLRGKPYHISALYVVDLETFRRTLVGDQLRAIYQQLSADPNSLANLDQDLPNYAQHQVPIFSLPQEWLWCESWCSDETKALAKTIDLCNNPLHKEPKVSMAKRVISGSLFNESWVDLDAIVERYDQEYRASLSTKTATS